MSNVMDNKVSFQPFIRIIIPLIIGIIIQYYAVIPTIVNLILFVLSTILLIVFSNIKQYQQLSVSGILVFTTFMFLGMYILKPTNDNSPKDKNLFVGKLIDIPNEKNKTYQTTIHIDGVRLNDTWHKQDFKIMAFIEKDSILKTTPAGCQIVFYANLNDIADKKNPFDFDYKNYLSLKNINRSVYLKSHEWRIINTDYNNLRAFALNVRQKLIKSFAQHGITDEQLAVFSALTLGYKNKLDAELKQAYAGAGAMHVLAVSGMHVGIIFLVLNAIFDLVFFFNRNNKLKYIIIILCIWGYALLSGLSISVQRASLMLTFILVGNIINRNINIYNSLSASAFLLLMINPKSLFDVSFQLSYIAVIGIVFFYPKIYNWLHINNFIGNKLWELTAVSLSAQLSTFPLGLYYFHQFPTFFWLSNIVVSLSAMILLLGGMILVMFNSFNIIANGIGYILNAITNGVNAFILWTNTLPMAVIEDINFNKVQVLVMYAIIIFGSAWLIRNKYKLLIGMLCCIILFSITYSYNTIKVYNQEVICVYNVRKASALHFINKNKSVWLTYNSENIKEQFISDANRFWHSDTSKIITTPKFNNDFLFRNKNFFKTKNYSFCIIDDKTIFANKYNFTDTINLDFILLRGKTYIRPDDIPKCLRFKNVITDGSVPTNVTNYWKKFYNVYDTKTEGAYILY